MKNSTKSCSEYAAIAAILSLKNDSHWLKKLSLKVRFFQRDFQFYNLLDVACVFLLLSLSKSDRLFRLYLWVRYILVTVSI